MTQTTAIHEIARRLNSALGPTLVAALAGGEDIDASRRWARPDGPVPRPEAEDRMRFAAEQWVAVSGAEGEQLARAWFISLNPWLGSETPVDAIRNGRFKETAAAAAALVEDAFSG